ncbi:MAG: hypothetical protein KDD99_33000, partial [Bacteroidetes bacterium]|nr:hypothetical protein [Bacteroidota bacterium]
MNFFKKYSFLLFLLSASTLFAQKSTITEEDFDRAWYFQNIRNQVYNLDVEPNWVKDQSGFWYIADTEEGEICWTVSFYNLEKAEAFDREQLAQLLRDSL